MLDQDIMYLPGVGPKKKEILSKELGICSYGDLLEYYPYKYVDRTKVFHISELTPEMPFVQIKGRILSFEEFDMGKRNKRVVAHFSDGFGVADLVWFRGAQYIYKTYKTDTEYIVFGKPTLYGGRFQFAHPDIDDAQSLQLSDMGMQPYYGTTEKMKKMGLTSRAIEKIAKALIEKLPALPETLPDFITHRLHLVSRDEAFRNIHYPHSHQELQKAQVRLKFEELFYVQLNILRYASDQRRKYQGYVFNRVGEIFNSFYANNLPFSLTGAQKRVMHEIRADMCSGKQMNRLLQGDVGSGKTIVAVLALLNTALKGYQAAMMAPTEVLASQHYESITSLFEAYNIPIKVVLLTGSMTAKEKRRAYDRIECGLAKIIVGTHALIQDAVYYDNLALVVTDEQHRFGVKQRESFAKKGGVPHVLVMSATPIPRTLAIILYGDLDISVIDELPANRLPIKNCVVDTSYRQTAYTFMKKQIAEGRQCYIICPMVEESEAMEVENVTDYSRMLQEEMGTQIVVDHLHGKMKQAAKDEIMERFGRNEIQILVSTTVIEVGIDVPNATVMMIENAERFGLAQLHQLRGRVGRGKYQSYCIFMTGSKAKETKKRLEILNKTNDGFKIASEDLKLRGPGDLFGIRQSGLMDFGLGDIYQDAAILQKANEAAEWLLKNNPEYVQQIPDYEGTSSVII